MTGRSGQSSLGSGSRLVAAALGLLFTMQAAAYDLPRPTATGGPTTTASVHVAFTPGDDAAAQIIEVIAHAQRQVLVQAYSFTHDGIARALVDAHRRGIEVKLIADRAQTEKMRRTQVPGLARAGVPVWLDGEHLGAHSKVMIIDAGLPTSTIITGSYNFTRAAQYKNAENVVFISDSEALAQAYARNWQLHLAHARPLTIH